MKVFDKVPHECLNQNFKMRGIHSDLELAYSKTEDCGGLDYSDWRSAVICAGTSDVYK